MRERLLGGLTALFGLALFVWITPNYVTSYGGGIVEPDFFPNIATWLLIGLGTVQLVFPPPSEELPRMRELLRIVLAIVLALASLGAMYLWGYLAGSIALMVAVLIVIEERRPVYVALAAIAIPVGIWSLFEVVLERPLP